MVGIKKKLRCCTGISQEKGITGRTEVRLGAAVRDLEEEKRRRGTDSGEMAKPKQKKGENLNFSLFFLFPVSE